MQIGMSGLGRMGANMVRRLRAAGHDCVVWDHNPQAVAALVKEGATGAATLAELVKKLAPPRHVWLMIPAAFVDATLDTLAPLLSADDAVIDGGNSYYRDDIARARRLAERKLHYVDCGTSGGVWGLENGYALMVGGSDEAVATVQPIFDALSPERGYAHVGPVGAGHYVKMVHNGVEYGLMQAYAEGYAILAASPLGIDVEAAIGSWQEGSVVRSWLLDLLIRALAETPDLEGIASVAADSGEGRWTVTEAVANGVSAPVISAALFARFTSQHREDDKAMKVVSALRHQFGGHAIEMVDPKGEQH